MAEPREGDFRPSEKYDGGTEVFSGGQWLLVVTNPETLLAAVLRRFIVDGAATGEYVRLDDDGELVLDGTVQCTPIEALFVKGLIEEAERG